MTGKNMQPNVIVDLPMMIGQTFVGRMSLNIETGEFTGRMSTEWTDFMYQYMELLEVSFLGKSVPRVVDLETWDSFRQKFEAFLAMEDDRLKTWTQIHNREIRTIEEARIYGSRAAHWEAEQGATT